MTLAARLEIIQRAWDNVDIYWLTTSGAAVFLYCELNSSSECGLNGYINLNHIPKFRIIKICHDYNNMRTFFINQNTHLLLSSPDLSKSIFSSA